MRNKTVVFLAIAGANAALVLVVGGVVAYARWSLHLCCGDPPGKPGQLWVCQHRRARRYHEGHWRRLTEDQYAAVAMAQLNRDMRIKRGGVF